jgi:hypothetical protein
MIQMGKCLDCTVHPSLLSCNNAWRRGCAACREREREREMGAVHLTE